MATATVRGGDLEVAKGLLDMQESRTAQEVDVEGVLEAAPRPVLLGHRRHAVRARLYHR